MPCSVSLSVSLCVSLAVSLICFEPFIYRHCGVSLPVSLPVPQFVPCSVSQFGGQFGVDAMSPRHISHPSLGNGWVTCAGSLPRPMCHGQRGRAASGGVSLWPTASARKCVGGQAVTANVVGRRSAAGAFHYGQWRRAASSGSGRFGGSIMANGVGRRRGRF